MAPREGPALTHPALVTQERALTTVTYLLALAELARAPFALVDEINQGMDQRAERNMHKMLVETTCKADVGQCVSSETLVSCSA